MGQWMDWLMGSVDGLVDGWLVDGLGDGSVDGLADGSVDGLADGVSGWTG